MIDLVSFFDGALPADMSFFSDESVLAMSTALGLIRSEFDREAIEINPVVQAIHVYESPQCGVAVDSIVPQEILKDGESTQSADALIGEDFSLFQPVPSGIKRPMKLNPVAHKIWMLRTTVNTFVAVTGLAMVSEVAIQSALNAANSGKGELPTIVVGPMSPVPTPQEVRVVERATELSYDAPTTWRMAERSIERGQADENINVLAQQALGRNQDVLIARAEEEGIMDSLRVSRRLAKQVAGYGFDTREWTGSLRDLQNQNPVLFAQAVAHYLIDDDLKVMAVRMAANENEIVDGGDSRNMCLAPVPCDLSLERS
jgi:hypothetical protein